MLENFSDLDEAGAHEADQDAGHRDEDDGARSDEAVGLGRCVENGRELVHQGDDADGEPREPQAARTVIGEEFALLQDKNEQPDQDEIQRYQDNSLHYVVSGYNCRLFTLKDGVQPWLARMP